jgi:hypothetical protein
VPERLFVFIQMEFPWALGPSDGRYLKRGEREGEAEQVVVFGTLSAHRAADLPRAPLRGPAGRLARRMGGDEPRPASPAPAAVQTTRVTVIDPVPISAEHQGEAWLEDIDSEHEIERALAVLNDVVQSHRIASADPYVHEVSSAQALVIRAGWGEGEQVADGRWLKAVELNDVGSGRARRRARRRGGSKQRTAALRPQERLAALLGARNETLVCEELVLRARLDLDQDRLAHSTLELRGALAAAVRELSAEGRQDLAIRIAELEQLRAGVEQQATQALDVGRTAVDADVVSHALERLEAALRARTAPGFHTP